MKLNRLVKSLSVVIAVSFLSVAGMTNTAEAEVSIITLKMSDELRAVRDKLKTIKTKLAIDQKNIPAEIEKLKKNYSLAFPKAEMKNTLSSKKYGDNPIYALKNGKKHDAAVWSSIV